MEYGNEVSSERSREEQTITEVRENECPICISSMASSMTITTRCLHTFCYDCLTIHINSTTNIGENRNRKCPCCREYLFDDEEQMEQIGPNELELTAVEIQDIVDYYIGDNNENEEPEIENINNNNINNNNQLNEENYFENINNNNIIGWQYRNDNLENYYSNSNYIHQIPHQLPGRLEQIMNGQGLENVTLTRG
uniref:RING-type domain-containing protein n=1 Tax=viral metagenome TaxID=1070528 RepID=A0A6C0JFL6_9ZZZZ